MVTWLIIVSVDFLRGASCKFGRIVADNGCNMNLLS